MIWPNIGLNYAFLSGYTNAKIQADLDLYYKLGFRKIRVTFADYNASQATITQIMYACATAANIGYTDILTGCSSINSKLTQETLPTYHAFQKSFAALCVANGVTQMEIGNETERDNLFGVGAVTQTGNVATVPINNNPFQTGDLIYATGLSPTNYNTPAYVSASNKGGAVCTRIDANSFTYPISGNPTSPATGGFIRFANVGILEMENDLLAQATVLRSLYPSLKFSYSFNDTYLSNWISIGVAGISSLDFLGFHKYTSIPTFKTDITSFLTTFGSSGKAQITEWGSTNGRNDFITTNAQVTNWQRNWELDTFKRLQILKQQTALLSPGSPCYVYAVNEGQQIWSMHNNDTSYNYPFFVLAGIRRNIQ